MHRVVAWNSALFQLGQWEEGRQSVGCNSIQYYGTDLDDWSLLAENYEGVRKLVGKTLWVIDGYPDPYNDKINARKRRSSLESPGRLEPFKVGDVTLSDEHLAPFRLILVWKGEKFLKDVNCDRPRINQKYWHLYRFQGLFLEDGPTPLH